MNLAPLRGGGTSCQVRTVVSWGRAHDHELSWKVELTVTFGPDDTRAQSPYSGGIHLAGFFTVSPAWPADQGQQLVGINGPSMLYGAAREMVLLAYLPLQSRADDAAHLEFCQERGG